jgi:hypothetical protein
MTRCSLDLPQRRFGGTHCLHLQSSRVSLTRKQASRNKHWTGWSVCLVNWWWSSPAHSFLVEGPSRITTIFYCVTNLGVVHLSLVSLEVTLYIYIRKVLLSNLDRDIRYSDWDCSWYFSVPPRKPRNSTYLRDESAPFHILSNPSFNCILPSMLYSLGTHSVIKI